MSFTERTSVSGTALSYLLKECINSSSRQEGFLFGNVTENITNHISDSRTDNARVEILINVTSMMPVPEPGMFYSPSGAIKEDVLSDILDGVCGNVVGWYHYRQNNSLKPMLRDRLISKSLHNFFIKHHIRYFLYCSMTSKQSVSNSTHTYTYKFYKVTKHRELEPLVDLTNNLGENVSGYKRTRCGDKNDEYNKAVMEAIKDGGHSVVEAVRSTLEKAIMDAAQWEAKSRELASDINCMLAMLANHYQAEQSNMSKKIVKEVEQQVLKPIVDVVSVPEVNQDKRQEPFDFVNDIIRNNLKPTPNEHGKSVNNFVDNINCIGDVKVEEPSTSSSGQKLKHPEATQSELDKQKSSRLSPSWDVAPSMSSSPSSPSNSHQPISDI